MLVIGTSHISRLINIYEHLNLGGVSFLSYPGGCLTNDGCLMRVKQDLRKVMGEFNITKLYIHFGSNDVDKMSSLMFPMSNSTSTLDDAIIHGISNDGHVVDIADPLQVIDLYPSNVTSVYDNFFSDYFCKINELIEIVDPPHVTIFAFMGRFLKGINHHIGYNRACYYFRNRLFTRYCDVEGSKCDVVDLFVDSWLGGSSNLLKNHAYKEIVNTVFQDLY